MVAWASGRQRQAALALGGAKEPQMPPHPRKYQGRVWRRISIGGQRQKMFLASRRRQCMALTMCLPPQVALKKCQPLAQWPLCEQEAQGKGWSRKQVAGG